MDNRKLSPTVQHLHLDTKNRQADPKQILAAATAILQQSDLSVYDSVALHMTAGWALIRTGGTQADSQAEALVHYNAACDLAEKQADLRGEYLAASIVAVSLMRKLGGAEDANERIGNLGHEALEYLGIDLDSLRDTVGVMTRDLREDFRYLQNGLRQAGFRAARDASRYAHRLRLGSSAFLRALREPEPADAQADDTAGSK